jgi:hypothetical protein
MVLNRDSLMSCFISESLTREAYHRNASALHIVDAELGTGIHAEVEFSQVAVQVLLVHVLINADQSALEDREETFKGVGMYVAARPFAFGMVDRLMLIFGRHEEFVAVRSVSDQAARIVQMLAQGIAHIAMIQVHGADRTAALDQAEHHRRGLGIQRQASRFTGLGRLGQVGFVRLDGLAEAAQWAGGTGRHGMTNPMAHEPRGFHAAAEHPLQLPGADAFLGRTHQVDGLQPVSHRDVTVLENGADFDGELLTALIAFTKSWASGFARELVNTGLIAVAAVRANRAGRPEISLYVFVGGIFIFEVRGVEVRVHDFGSGMAKSCACERGLSSVTSPKASKAHNAWFKKYEGEGQTCQ